MFSSAAAVCLAPLLGSDCHCHHDDDHDDHGDDDDEGDEEGDDEGVMISDHDGDHNQKNIHEITKLIIHSKNIHSKTKLIINNKNMHSTKKMPYRTVVS